MRDRETESSLAMRGRLLNERAIPGLLTEQLERFTVESLRAKPVRRFSAHRVLDDLRANDDRTVVAVDIGGDKITASFVAVHGTTVQRSGDVLSRRSDGGAGYLDALREVADAASALRAPVGLSFAGPVDGTRILAGPNLPAFMADFTAAYDGDLANLFPHVEVANDAEAGMMAGALEAARRYPDAQDVVYLINGSGLGGAVLTGEILYATEPGHIPVTDTLNVFGQDKACGMDGATFVCVEAVAASKSGIEDIWRKAMGDSLPGHEISARYLDGHQLATDLYDSSAHVVAHVIKGIAGAFGLLDGRQRLVVVAHGGIFHVPGYGDRLHQILENDLEYSPPLIFTREFSDNMCLEGAAIAAVCKGL